MIMILNQMIMMTVHMHTPQANRANISRNISCQIYHEMFRRNILTAALPKYFKYFGNYFGSHLWQCEHCEWCSAYGSVYVQQWWHCAHLWLHTDGRDGARAWGGFESEHSACKARVLFIFLKGQQPQSWVQEWCQLKNWAWEVR